LPGTRVGETYAALVAAVLERQNGVPAEPAHVVARRQAVLWTRE
jgi:hypothetical protein